MGIYRFSMIRIFPYMSLDSVHKRENVAQRNFIFAYLMQCPTESIDKLRYNILLQCTCKVLCMKYQTSCTDILQCIFFQLQVTVYISGSVTVHLLGTNTEHTEFLPNPRGFKLCFGVDIRFEQIKST